MYFLYPTFYLLNGITTHCFLQKNSPAYTQLEGSLQHELIGRWNNSLGQLLLVAVMFSSSTPESVETAAILFGTYLLTDMVHMFLYCYDWIYYLHHIIPMLFYATLWKIVSFDVKIALIFTTGILEITTPPISLVWILSKLQLKRWYTLYLSVFAYLNFFAFRIVYFPYLWYTDVPFIAQIVTLPYHGMNIFWFGKMTSYLLKSTP